MKTLIEDQSKNERLEDLRQRALQHYEEASKAIHHWSSFVVRAIEEYNPNQFTHDRGRVIEVFQKYGSIDCDSRPCVYDTEWDKIADELYLPDHSEDNLDMISLPKDGAEGCQKTESLPREEKDELQALINEIAEWSDKTFGDGQRNPAIVYHLKKEVDEIISIMNKGVVTEYERQTLLMEYADCFMLLMDSVTHSFFSVKDLIEATKAKLEINKKRKWGNPDINGVIEHIESSKEEQHETCDGCEMFSESGCMLDDSCPECVKHYLWTPKEEQAKKEEKCMNCDKPFDITEAGCFCPDCFLDTATSFEIEQQIEEYVGNHSEITDDTHDKTVRELCDIFKQFGYNDKSKSISLPKEEQAKDDFTDEDAEHAITGN